MAALDDAEFERQGRERAEKLKAQFPAPGRQGIGTNAYARAAFEAGTFEMSKALAPLRYGGQYATPSAAERRAAEAAADENVLAVVAKQEAIHARAEAVHALYNAPERRSDETIWNTYTRGVSAVAFTKGTKEADFVRKFRDLIAALLDAGDYDDDAAACSIEARLDKLTAPVKYPVLPEAAWEAADTYPLADREAEYARLEAKYGARNAATNGKSPSTNGHATVPKTSVLRKRASAAALH